MQVYELPYAGSAEKRPGIAEQSGFTATFCAQQQIRISSSLVGRIESVKGPKVGRTIVLDHAGQFSIEGRGLVGKQRGAIAPNNEFARGSGRIGTTAPAAEYFIRIRH